MKKKILLLTLLIVTLATIVVPNMKIYAVSSDFEATDIGGNEGTTKCATCSYGSYVTTTEATCETNGIETATCSVCGDTKTRSIAKLNYHSYGSFVRTKTSATCTSTGIGVAKCKWCGKEYEYTTAKLGHNLTGSCANTSLPIQDHYQLCARCSEHISTVSYPENERTETETGGIHKAYCKICKVKSEELNHKWINGDYVSKTAHKCADCGLVRTKYPYHSFKLYSWEDGIAPESSYPCIVEGCGGTLEVTNDPFAGYWPRDKYVMAQGNSSLEYDPPALQSTYTVNISHPQTDINGDFVSIGINESDRMYGTYTRGTMKQHVEEYNDGLEILQPDGTYVSANIIGYLEPDIIDWPDQYFVSWFEGSFGWIDDGIGSIAEQEMTSESSPTTIILKYPAGGNKILLSGFFTDDSSFCAIFSDGDNPVDELKSHVVWNYATIENETPKNNGIFKGNHYKTGPTIYSTGKKSGTASVNAELNIIDNSGYRYVGYSIRYGYLEDVINASPISYNANNVNPESIATASLSYAPNKVAALITFYVEPVTLTYGHAWKDYSNNLDNYQILSGDGLGGTVEFPDFYDEKENKCIVPVKSLNKFFWPGFILDSASLTPSGEKVGDTKKEIWGKEYDEDTTTIYSPTSGASRLTVTEKIYTSDDEYNENNWVSGKTGKGYAVDRQFYFYYHTPTLEISHVDYDTNELINAITKTKLNIPETSENSPIEYTMQILHQWALIGSLVTDNIGIPHQLSVDDISDGALKFVYDVSKTDLVQLEIYEISYKKTKSGIKETEKHYATLYADEEYKPSSGTKCKVENYNGIFEEYYADSLSSIISQIGKDKTFNTNKNWRMVFKYRPIDRVHIRFMDLKGNSIFIEDPENPGRYIGEISEKISKEKGYSYTVVDLGDNSKFKAVSYTEDTNAYIKDHNVATNVSAGTILTVPGNTGDRYIVIFYSTEKSLKVEYRDEKENEIRPPMVVELPSTGTVIEVPEIPLYDIKEYKLDDDYDGVGDIIGNNPDGTPIYGISGTPITLTVDDKEISVTNTEEKDKHIIIYYTSNESLKVEYRDISGDTPLPVPPDYITTTTIEIPETGTKIEVPVVPGYEVKYYKVNTNYNGTDTTIPGSGIPTTGGSTIPVASNGNNQFIIIYYEKINVPTIKVTIEYREDVGGTPTGPELKTSITIEIPLNEELPIGVPEIPGYNPKYYVESGDSTPKDIPTVEYEIIVESDPETGDQKIIIAYIPSEPPIDKPEPPTPTIITPDDNKEKVVLRANSQLNEEYDVEVAIPTSEDLYISGDLFTYRFVGELEKTPLTEDIKVEIVQKYYTKLNDDDPTKSLTSTVSTGKMDVTIAYNYYTIKDAKLYDLKSMELVNNAIKYYNGYIYDESKLGVYQEGKATYPALDAVPELYYTKPTGVGTEDTNRLQITSQNGYNVTKKSDGTYVITLSDVAYVKPNMSEFKAKYKAEAEGIIEKCTNVRVQSFGIKMAGKDDVVILTGEQYPLTEKTVALDSAAIYLPYTTGRAPLYHFVHSSDLFVQEKAENKTHLSTITGDYRLIQSISGDSTSISSHEPINGAKLQVEKINVNSLNVHTPIVNKSTLTPSKENLEATQLSDKAKENIKEEIKKAFNITNDETAQNKLNELPVLNLDEKFTIIIQNSGDHITAKNYGAGKMYNHEGLKPNDDAIEKINIKSNNELVSGDLIKNEIVDGKVETKVVNPETEKDAVGPAFAEYKLIRFPYDVYLLNADETKYKKEPQLFKANHWYNLYAYLKPSEVKYEFALPVWVKDSTLYAKENGIQVLVVAENCKSEDLQNVLNSANILTAVKEVESNANAKNTTYIIRKTFDTYVSGRVYDITVRDSDDPGYTNKVKPALSGDKLPLGQAGQVGNYKMGLKLGYRFYFDLKTKGISNITVGIRPKVYYVPTTGGTATDKISLFYHSKNSLYNKLTTSNDLTIRMALSSTHGVTNNAGYTAETVSAKQLVPARVFTTINNIGTIINGLTLKDVNQKLPYNNIEEEAKKLGFVDATGKADITKFLESAKLSESINDADPVRQNEIKNSTGHWYGEYYLPASTIVVDGASTDRNTAMGGTKTKTSGYLIVAFEEITTGVKDAEEAGKGYLTYDAPEANTQWQKEKVKQDVKLPNGSIATVSTNGAVMAIYQVGLRANNDYETEGSH